MMLVVPRHGPQAILGEVGPAWGSPTGPPYWASVCSYALRARGWSGWGCPISGSIHLSGQALATWKSQWALGLFQPPSLLCGSPSQGAFPGCPPTPQLGKPMVTLTEVACASLGPSTRLPLCYP